MTTEDEPEPLRILVRNGVAFGLLTAALLVVLRLPRDVKTLAFLLGWSLGAAVAFSVAEALMRRVGIVGGLLAGALLSPLAALGGVFERAFVVSWSAPAATTEVVTVLRAEPPAAWGAGMLGALLVYGPLLIALRRRLSPLHQALGMLVGAALWSVVAVLGPWRLSEGVPPEGYGVAFVAAAVLVPLGRRLGDRAWRVARRRTPAPRSRHGGRAHLARVLALASVLAGAVAALHVPREWFTAEEWRLRARASTGMGEALPWAERLFGWFLPSTGPSAPHLLLTTVAPIRSDASIRFDREGAEALLRIAVLQGRREALFRLATACQENEHAQTLEEALEVAFWLRQAAAAGDVEAMMVLGEGTTVPDRWGGSLLVLARSAADRVALAEEGLAWVERAAALGHPPAIESLVWLAHDSPSKDMAHKARRVDRAISVLIQRAFDPLVAEALDQTLWLRRSVQEDARDEAASLRWGRFEDGEGW